MNYFPSRRRGFTLIELLLVLGVIAILAALVIPKLVMASNDALANTAQMQINSARRALERYKVEHNDTYPAIGDMWTVLVSKTDGAGNVAADGGFGPYLLKPPLNPYTNSATLAAPGSETDDDGWTYDPTADSPLQLVGFDESTGTYAAPD